MNRKGMSIVADDASEYHLRLLAYDGCDDREPKPGIEPGAFRLLGGRSGQLSYKGTAEAHGRTRAQSAPSGTRTHNPRFKRPLL